MRGPRSSCNSEAVNRVVSTNVCFECQTVLYPSSQFPPMSYGRLNTEVGEYTCADGFSIECMGSNRVDEGEKTGKWPVLSSKVHRWAGVLRRYFLKFK